METLSIKVTGMDCAECASHVQSALCALPGVSSAKVYLGAEKAVITHEGDPPANEEIKIAVKEAGYGVEFGTDMEDFSAGSFDFGKKTIFLFISAIIAILATTILGESLGLFEWLNDIIPWYIWAAVVILWGWPIYRNVLRNLAKGRIISHTLMSASVVTAAIVGQWSTALLIIAFMRFGDFIEQKTTEGARSAVKALTRIAPKQASILKYGVEIKVPISELAPGDVIITRPGEAIAVDGIVIDGHASVDESAITGESIPVEKIVGKNVFAASILVNGTLKIKATAVGEDSTFGQIIRMVEEAEANRGDVQRYADKFAAWYLPIVAGVALITYAIRRDPISAAAVMVVACSCSFSLATPVAMLAAIGNSAKDGLLFKGGKYVEELSSADIVLIDKTGTLTIGNPRITDIVPVKGTPKIQLLSLCASAERYSEHPLADAVLEAAQNVSVPLLDSDQFNNLPGRGVEAIINTDKISVLNKPLSISPDFQDIAKNLFAEGKTLLFIHKNDMLIGLMAAEDTLREETKDALTELRSLGLDRIKLISGDNEAAVKKIADILAIDYQSEMKPEEKIALVRQMQANGNRVVMIGDGINDAPALAQADIGFAMGHSGTQIASESAHIVLMREDWGLVPDAVRTARRTMRVVKTNILFTVLYNLVGLSLAAVGLLPPAIAAAMQSIPDIGIMANSARLLSREDS